MREAPASRQEAGKASGLAACERLHSRSLCPPNDTEGAHQARVVCRHREHRPPYFCGLQV